MSTVTCMASGRAAVLNRIQESSLKPTELLTAFCGDYSYAEIQEAISDLLERGYIVLTSDRYLKPAGRTKEE